MNDCIECDANSIVDLELAKIMRFQNDHEDCDVMVTTFSGKTFPACAACAAGLTKVDTP